MVNNRRFDISTSLAITEAFKLQRLLGFEPAFLMLRSRGVDSQLARELLNLPSERRQGPRPEVTSEQHCAPSARVS